MTDSEALALVVARTGHRRFLEQLDPAHPDYDPRYWPHVRRMAEEPPPEPSAPRFDGELAKRVITCPDRERHGCGCAGRWVCKRTRAQVAYQECLTCVGGG